MLRWLIIALAFWVVALSVVAPAMAGVTTL